METETSKTRSARLPGALADRLDEDARVLRMKPGTLLRLLIEARYLGTPIAAGKSDRDDGKSNSAAAIQWKDDPNGD